MEPLFQSKIIGGGVRFDVDLLSSLIWQLSSANRQIYYLFYLQDYFYNNFYC